LAQVRGAYCAAVERSVENGGDGEEEGATAAARVAYVSVLAVDPPAQGQGLGTRLLRDVLRELLGVAIEGEEGEEDGNTTVATSSHAYVEASSERSAALYERLGFRVIAAVDADGGVRAAGAMGAGGADEQGEGGDDDEGEDDGGGGNSGSNSSSYYSLPRAPTLVMATELKGRFREWLLMEG
jgi:GNAT superfamily N-acetyltransferase